MFNKKIVRTTNNPFAPENLNPAASYALWETDYKKAKNILLSHHPDLKPAEIDRYCNLSAEKAQAERVQNWDNNHLTELDLDLRADRIIAQRKASLKAELADVDSVHIRKYNRLVSK